MGKGNRKNNNKKNNETTNVMENTSNDNKDNTTAKVSEKSRLKTELSKAKEKIQDLGKQLQKKKTKILELEKQLQEKNEALNTFIKFNENDLIATESYGLKVYKGLFGGQEKAIKKVTSKDNQRYEFSVNRSILNYRHLLQVSYVVQSADVLYFVMDIFQYNALDYIEKGLANHINLAPLKVLKHVLKATAKLHQFNIVHGNINADSVRFMAVEKMRTTENIDTHKYITVIGDFGLCRKGRVAGGSDSSLHYSAPEISDGQSTGTCEDILSVGKLSQKLLAVKYPFDNDLNERSQNQKIQTDPIQSHLLKNMVDKTASKRPSASALLKGPLFWGACRRMDFLSAVVDYYHSIKKLKHLNCVLMGGNAKNWWESLPNEFHDFLNSVKDVTYDPWSGKDFLRAFRNLWIHFARLRALKEQKAQDLYAVMCKISPYAMLRLYGDALKKEGILEFLTEKSFKLGTKPT